MEIDFDKIYVVVINILKLTRSHPEVARDQKWALQFGIMHGIFTLTYISMAYNIALALELGDYSDACRHGVSSVVYFVVSFQYFILVLKQNTILKLMNLMKDDFKKSLPHDEKMIVLEYAKKGSNLCKQWLILCITTGSLFPVKHLIFEIVVYIKGEFIVALPYPQTLPSPLEENINQPIVYIVVYLIQLFYLSYGSCVYICFVPLGPSFMLHACGQLEIVKKRALDVFNTIEEEEVRVKLIEIVKQLQYIYEILNDIIKNNVLLNNVLFKYILYFFIDCIKDSFRAVYEITMKGTTILLPVALYQVISSLHRGELSIEFIAFIIGGILISSAPCYYSEMLIKKGEDVRLAIYSCGWEAKYDHRARKIILVILQRSLRPTSIRSMFRTLCLETLTDVFQQSYALFNLMNAAWS